MSPEATAATPTMKALVQDAYGPPESLRVEEVPRPAIAANEILLRVEAVGINPADWFTLTGVPYIMRAFLGLRRPRARIGGSDVAGVVQEVGVDVQGLRPGDAVFGSARQALAEFARAKPGALAPKPEGMSFTEAAAAPMAALTALTALRDIAKVQAGQRILINGASGGIGTYAVQIGKSMGAEVTGVCSTRNVELVSSLGADRVFDYTQEDFTASGQRWDLVLDNAGNHKLAHLRRAVAPDGLLIPNNGTQGGRWLGPLLRLVGTLVRSWFGKQRARSFVQLTKTEDLLELTRLVQSGEVRSVIDEAYPLDRAGEAFAHVGAGHARGKVVVTVAGDGC